MKKILTIESAALIFLLIGFIMVYSIISLTTHNHFATFGWDLGFFDQIIWKVSHGDIIAYSTIAHENLLADHFQPVLYLMSIVYLVKPDVRMLLISQSFLVVLAAFPLYFLVKHKTKSTFFSFVITISYLLFMGTQWTILNEFHQVAFVPLFLSLLFYGLESNNTRLYWLSILGLLGTKEEISLLVASLGLIAWLSYKRKIEGIITMIIGIISFFLLICFIMPALSVNGTYSHNDFGVAGYSAVDVLKKSIVDPAFFAKSMITPPVKIQTVFYSFASFGFVPLLSSVNMIPIFGHFAARFIYAGPQFTKWVNVNHHAAPLGILLSIATVCSVMKVANFSQNRWKIKKKNVYLFIGIYILLTTFVQDIFLHGPIHSITKKSLYENQPWMTEVKEALFRIPNSASVSSQNNLFPHISQRKEIYLLPEIGNASYVLIDIHESSNAFSPLIKSEMQACLNDLLIRKNFHIEYHKGEVYLLKRESKKDSGDRKPEYCTYEI